MIRRDYEPGRGPVRGIPLGLVLGVAGWAGLVALVLAARELLSLPAPAGQPLGHRRHDPRHTAGIWHPERDATPPEQQATGRPWRGARDNREESR